MLLSAGDVVALLCSKNKKNTNEAYIDQKGISYGKVTVIEELHRNRIFKVDVISEEKSEHYFLKQPPLLSDIYLRSMKIEACIYEYTATKSGIACYLPKYYFYDQELAVLLLENLVGSVSYFEHLQNRSFSFRHLLPISISMQLGKMLAELHRGLNQADIDNDFLNKKKYLIIEQKPTIFQDFVLFGAPPTNLKHIWEKLIIPCRELSNSWDYETVLHGDLKFNNILVDSLGKFYIIDWESTHLGTKYWDISSIVGNYELMPIYYPSLLKPFQILQSINIFLNAYSDISQNEINREICNKMTGAYLFQKVYFQSLENKLDEHSQQILQRAIELIC